VIAGEAGHHDAVSEIFIKAQFPFRQATGSGNNKQKRKSSVRDRRT
jgi:hypothetical protein